MKNNFHIRDILLIVCMGAGGVLVGCGKHDSPQAHMESAGEFAAKGDLRSTIIELKNVVQNSPDNAQARLQLAENYILGGYGEDAEKELRKAAELGTNPEATKIALAQALLLRGKYDNVIKEIQPGEQTSPLNASRIKALHAEAMMEQGQVDKACELFAIAQTEQADNVLAMNGMARCVSARKDFTAAKVWANKTLAIDPRNYVAWLILADAERLTNRHQEADQAFAKAIMANPYRITAYHMRAFHHVQTKNYEAALQDLQAGSKKVPNHFYSNYLMALIHYQQGQYAKAQEYIQKALNQAPSDIATLFLSGNIAYSLGQYEQAESNLSRVLSAMPDSPDLKKMLAATQVHLKRGGKALETIKPLLNANNQDGQLYEIAANAHIQDQNYRLGSDYLEKALAITPNRSGLLLQYGEIEVNTGEKNKGLQALESAAQISPNDSRTVYQLVMALVKEKQLDRALAYVKSVQQKAPKAAHLVNLEGVVHQTRADVANAKASYARAIQMDAKFVLPVINFARLEVREKHLDAANERLSKFSQANPDNVQALLALSELAMARSKPAEFVDLLNRAVKLAPRDMGIRAQLISHALANKEYEKALVFARNAYDTLRDNPEALLLLAKTQQAGGDSNNAASSFNRLTSTFPKYAAGHGALGLYLHQQGKSVEALKHLEAALTLDPGNSSSRMYLIMAQVKLGKLDDALKSAAQLEAEHPKSALGVSLQGDIYLSMKRYKEAEVAYARAAKIQPSSGLATKQHMVLAKRGALPEADRLASDWLKQHPNDGLYRLYLAEFYLLRGMDDAAIKQYRFVVTQNPNNPSALNNLANLLASRKDPEALKYAEMAYKMKSDHPSTQDTLGWALVQAGQLDKGLDLLAKAHDAARDNAEIHYHYASALYRKGNANQARTELRNLLAQKRIFSGAVEAQQLLKQIESGR